MRQKRKSNRPTEAIAPATTSPITPDVKPSEGQPRKIPIADIDPSPFNYRRVFPAQSMEELATSVAVHGIIENLTVRLMPSGRYELVTGERRFRAAKMAGLTEIPATIRGLTDDQVREIQLTENLQREDPHPLDEAEAINRLMEQHQSIDNITARLGKSRAFIYGRIKLTSLIAPFRDIFAAGILTLTESLAIATLSADSQQEFFNDYFEEWQDEEFEKPDVKDLVSGYQHDLTDAKFDIHDETLLPDAGACTRCPFNSSTVPTLFPELADEANCTNGACFDRKCEAHFARSVHQSVKDYTPQALLFYGSPSTRLQEILAIIPEASGLPYYDYRRVYSVNMPEAPDRDEYMDEENTDGSDDSTSSEGEGFAEALQEYEAELEIYHDRIRTEELIPGLLIGEHGSRAIAFNPNPIIPDNSNAGTCAIDPPNVTAKAVEAAIKEGTATPGLLEAGIARIQERETRLKELDREKVQLELHTRFLERLGSEGTKTPLTEADHAGINLVLYLSMDYSTMRQVETVLFNNRQDLDPHKATDLYKALSSLNSEEIAYLGRMALAAKSESKYPKTNAGHFLYQVAEQAGLDVQAIEQMQQAKAEARRKGQDKRIAELQKQIENLKQADAA